MNYTAFVLVILIKEVKGSVRTRLIGMLKSSNGGMCMFVDVECVVRSHESRAENGILLLLLLLLLLLWGWNKKV